MLSSSNLRSGGPRLAWTVLDVRGHRRNKLYRVSTIHFFFFPKFFPVAYFPCSFATCFRFADSPCSFVTCFIFVPSVALVFGIGFAFVFFCVVVCGYIGPKFGCADSRSGTPVSCREVATILGIQIVGLLGVATSQRFRYLAQVSPPHKI